MKDWLKKWGEPMPIVLVVIGVLGGVIVNDISGDIDYIKMGVNTLVARTGSQVSPSIGGKLTSYDERVTLFIEPGTVTEDVILSYQPTFEPALLASLPQDIRSTGYAFRVTPLSLSGFELPWLPLEKEKQVDLFVSFTEDDLRLASDNPNKLSIIYWNDRTRQWQILDSEVVGNSLYLHTDQLGQFLLAAEAAP